MSDQHQQLSKERLALLREHIADASGFVQIHASDLCALVDQTKPDNAGLKKSAAELRRMPTMVSLDVKHVEEMLDAAESGKTLSDDSAVDREAQAEAERKRREAEEAEKDQERIDRINAERREQQAREDAERKKKQGDKKDPLANAVADPTPPKM